MTGRFINQKDIKERTKNVIIGRLVAQDLFKRENPLGKYLKIKESAFKVVGVFQDKSGDREERLIYLPVSYTHLTLPTTPYV